MRISDWSSDVCSSDLLYVIPEPWDGLMRRLKPFPVRRYVFCQNHYYAFHGLAEARRYADAGIDTVFCCREVIAAFLTGTMGLDRAPVIHNAIEQALSPKSGG